MESLNSQKRARKLNDCGELNKYVENGVCGVVVDSNYYYNHFHDEDSNGDYFLTKLMLIMVKIMSLSL